MFSTLIRLKAGLIVVALLVAPLVAAAECVTVQLPKGERWRGPVAKPSLVFSGTVTAVDHERYTVTLSVDQVWTGRVKRATTLFVTPVVEGATTRSFRSGAAYLVSYSGDVHQFAVAEPYFPEGTLGVAFGCGDGPVPLDEAAAELKRLGRGRAPLP